MPDPLETATQDHPITDPQSGFAVQIPEEADASNPGGGSVHDEPTPIQVFAGTANPEPDTAGGQDAEEGRVSPPEE